MWKSLKGVHYYESKSFESLSYEATKSFDGPKFALFDLDKTLITPKNARNPYTLQADSEPSNYTFLCDEEDLFNLLQSLKRKGYVIAIISNQRRYTDMTQNRIEHFRKYLEKNLSWSPYIFLGLDKRYAKPSTESFKLLCKLLGYMYFSLNVEKLRKIEDGIPNFFMVGDASGPKDPFPPYRYASTDSDFARNLSLLLSKKYVVCQYIRPIDIFGSIEITPRDYQEMIITVGNPGSGKSTASFYLQKAGYKVCVSDIIRNKQKMIDCVRKNVSEGKSVVVDATNPEKEKRTEYIKIAKEFKIPVRILWFVRDGRPFNDTRGIYDTNIGGQRFFSTYYHKEPVPEVAFNVYSKNFNEPVESELKGLINSKIEKIF